MNKYKNIKGQAIIPGMALLAVAGIILFFIFNSSRAVNEKINLVNAADAAAYSGAQIAARQLNFMAYTNRIMVTNEVAIGHMVSYQAEAETVTNSLASMGGLFGGIIKTLANGLLAIVGESMESLATKYQDIVRGFSGAYVLGVSANNAIYSDFLTDEYNALLGIGQDSQIDRAMLAVAQQYAHRDNIVIELNSSDGISALENSPDPSMRNKANIADHRATLCQLIVFATPSNPNAAGEMTEEFLGVGASGPGNSTGNGNGNPGNGGNNGNDNNNGNDDGLMADTALGDYCTALMQGADLSSLKGSSDNPFLDGGTMFNLLQQTSQAAASSDWINNRNMDYQWFGADTERRGATSVEWDDSNGSYNWNGGNDTLDAERGLFGFVFNMHGTSNSDNNSNTVASSANAGLIQREMLDSAGMCDDFDCDSLNPANGHQIIQSYPRVNPLSNGQAVVTAVVTQRGLCNDTIGFDESGNTLAKFDHSHKRSNLLCDGDTTITAASSALLFYRTPAGSTQANMFNPYWQARLAQ